MEYQKLTTLLNNTSDRPPKFRTKNWVKINNVYYEIYNTTPQIEFKSLMLKSSIYDYSDVHVVIIIPKFWEVYGNTIEMKHL